MESFAQYVEMFPDTLIFIPDQSRLCYQAYFSSASDLHVTQMRAFMTFCANLIKKGTDEDDGGEQIALVALVTDGRNCCFTGFGGATPAGATGRAAAGVRRAGTIVRSPLEGRKERKEQNDGDMRASDVRFLSVCLMIVVDSTPIGLCASFRAHCTPDLRRTILRSLVFTD